MQSDRVEKFITLKLFLILQSPNKLRVNAETRLCFCDGGVARENEMSAIDQPGSR